MRAAFFSPLPPAKSGIADYSAAVLEPLARIISVDAFAERPAGFDASRYDVCVYQLGNNPYHTFAYEAALDHPGVVVLHEANLHHLIADLTIRRGDWDAYLREVEINAGAEALAYAQRHVRTLERGPDYSIPMLRTVLGRSRALIVHSEAVEEVVREHGFKGPVAKIPHGAWIVEADRMAYRARLGLDERAPLIGIFGFLKPYKRIIPSLRAFRRLIRLIPEARLILVGEAHPELALASTIASLGLSAHVRHIDFAPIGDFNGYMAACDIVLNLRYPTVGESSGTLLRALGMGKAVLVSDVGSFREYPGEICLKTPAGDAGGLAAGEEEHLFEYLNLLASRPEIARALGAKARAWVERECRWETVAARYADFLTEVAHGTAGTKEWADPLTAPVTAPAAAGADHSGVQDVLPDVEIPSAEAPASAPPPERPAIVSGETPAGVDAIDPHPAPAEQFASYIRSWAPAGDGAREYVESHLARLEKTLAITPPGSPEDRVLEMGAYLQITPALKARLGYGEVRGCYYGPAGHTDHRMVTSESGEVFECDVDLFDAEKDRFPYNDAAFATVLCCELLEHLPEDPMHMMSEINRILRPGGHLVLTTPNVASLRALAGILQGFHPQLFSSYIRPKHGVVDARHAREYTPREILQLLETSGFEATLLETGPFREEPKPELAWVEHLLDRYMLTREHRGDGIYAVGRKKGPVRERYPAWLYS
jgi:glycosyltransferase involved in cell wall biosynthesis/SAM-dependent methyltransferase